MSQDSPGRFGLFAALPLPDIEGSLREMVRARTLKADGIGLMTNYRDRWLGDASFAPVWEELNRSQKVVICTHPNTPTCCTHIKDEVGPGTIEWATDTTRTTASLLFSGTAARYPDIRWICLTGAALRRSLGRFIRQEADMKEREKRLPRGLMYELQKFYYDTAQANHPGALAALLKLAPVSRS